MREASSFPKVAGLLGALYVGFGVFLFFAAPEGRDGGISWTDAMIQNGWMAWTLTTAVFFYVIAGLLLIMILWGSYAPQAPRMGVLMFATTPGDRLFVSLLGSAFICLIWLATLGAPLWWALAICLVYAAAVFRWV